MPCGCPAGSCRISALRQWRGSTAASRLRRRFRGHQEAADVSERFTQRRAHGGYTAMCSCSMRQSRKISLRVKTGHPDQEKPFI
jgi:hypothetical protein